MNIDKSLIIKRFSSAIESYNTHATAQHQIAKGLVCDLLTLYTTKGKFPDTITEIGCGTGILSHLILKHLTPKSLILNDLCPDMKTPLKKILSQPNTKFIPGDAELIPLPQNQDLILSSSTIQWFVNPQLFLKKCHNALKPKGILAITTFAKDNLQQIKQLTQTSLPYSPLEIPDEFSVITQKTKTIELKFNTPTEVLQHLKKTGVNAIKSTLWTKATLDKFCEKYSKKFTAKSGKVTLTYNPITIILQKK